MPVDLNKLHPELVSRWKQLQRACEALGITLRVTQGFRSIAEQEALYAQGRTKPGPRVTNARGGSSYHNFGRALDFVFVEDDGTISWDERHPWNLVGHMGEYLGLSWGGRFKTFVDKPHFQWTGDGKTLDKLRAEAGIA